MVLCLKEKKLFKFLTISVILYYLVLNQMWCSQNLAQLSRATQDNLDCTVLLPPLAIHHYRFLAPALLFTQPVQKDKPVPTQHRFFRGTCSSGQLYYCKSWLEGHSRNMQPRACNKGQQGQPRTDQLQYLMKLHLDQWCFLPHNFKQHKGMHCIL